MTPPPTCTGDPTKLNLDQILIFLFSAAQDIAYADMGTYMYVLQNKGQNSWKQANDFSLIEQNYRKECKILTKVNSQFSLVKKTGAKISIRGNLVNGTCQFCFYLVIVFIWHSHGGRTGVPQCLLKGPGTAQHRLDGWRQLPGRYVLLQ